MVHTKVYRNGDIYGVFYHFGCSEDCIPMHDHAKGRKHNTIVLKGSVSVHGLGWAITLTAGDVFDFTEEQYPHEITALTPETLILNIYVHGVHAADVNMPDGIISTIPDGAAIDTALIDQPQRSFKWKM